MKNELLKKISKGDRQAFNEFYAKSFYDVLQKVQIFIKNESDIDGVVSEVFFQIWKNSKKIYKTHDIEAYIFIMIRNISYRHLRAKTKMFDYITIDTLFEETYGYESYIETSLEDKELVSIYEKAIKTLPKRCKQIYLLSREHKLKNKEIASLLDLTEGTVEQHMNTAIKKIIKYIELRYPSLQYS